MRFLLNRWWFTKLKVKHHKVDIDSTVITRYGCPDVLEVDYNPGKPGRGSHHHPLIWELYRHRIISFNHIHGGGRDQQDLIVNGMIAQSDIFFYF
jgi:hypothetical protein